MTKSIILLIKNILKKFNLKLNKWDYVNKLEKNEDEVNKLRLIVQLPKENLSSLIQNFNYSHAQFGQDLFVLSELGFKKNGYFVEFGATDGVEKNNTHILEKKFNWEGILAEPAKIWQKKLNENRKWHIDDNCVWLKSNATLVFNEVSEPELSTIGSFSSIDGHFHARRKGVKYNVNSISLNDLLKKYNAPKNIDYLSIDTEGSEFEILNNFDFSSYDIKIITCEHNFEKNREKVHQLLKKNGYIRKMKEFSKFDDWYIKAF